MPSRQGVAALLATLVLSACGSTVQQSDQVALGAGPQTATGLDGPTTTPGDTVVPGTGGPDVAGPAGGPAGVPDTSSAGAPGPRAQGRSDATTTDSTPGAASVSGRGGGVTPATTGTGPVTVGFFVAKDLGPATKALGVDGLASGNGRRQAEAAVKLVNSAGGIAGRPVRGVVYEFDVSGNAQTQLQAACSRFFEDNKALAVVSILQEDVLSRCAEQRGAVFIASTNRAPARVVLDSFPRTVVPSQLPLEKVVAVQIGSLVRQGWFRPAEAAEQVKIGLLYADSKDFKGVPAAATASLRSAGLSLALAQEMPVVQDTSDVGAASSAGSNAVLRFRAANINRVLVVDKSGQALTYFGLAAQNQSYFPRYGLSSLELPALLRTVFSARQLEGASGIGFAPLYDVPLRAQPAPNANVKACLAAMQGAGEDMQSSGTRAFALTTCDGALLLAAAGKQGDLSSAGLLRGLTALGRSHQPVMTPTVDFSRGRAPADGYRDLRFSASCDCFQYAGAVQRVP